jgi:3',5'-cyclic AMP phosphodiesterase CpdA
MQTQNGWGNVTVRLLLLLFGFTAFSSTAHSQITIAQISDTHIADKHAPHAAENLRHAVDMINERHPDAVILSGDIGENSRAWEEAQSILKALHAPLYYVPGNHDVHSSDVERYRNVFGKDYYSFRVKDVTFVVIDSQLLGNYDVYDAKEPAPLPAQTEEESERMLQWLATAGDNAENDEAAGSSKRDRKGKSDRDQRRERSQDEKPGHTVIGVQHIPVFHDGRFPDPKPYWVVSEPYRSQEIKLLHQLGIKDMLVGHWHYGRVFEREGITWHVAPSTAWLPWGGELGFAMHTISPDGNVRTEFVALPGAKP